MTGRTIEQIRRLTLVAFVIVTMFPTGASTAGNCTAWSLDRPLPNADTLAVWAPERREERPQRRLVMVRGIDAPEDLVSQCPSADGAAFERQLGVLARQWTIDTLDAAKTVLFCDPDLDTDPYGRLIATVLVDGVDLATLAIAAGYARR